MRPIGLGLIAALIVAVLAPAAVMSAPKGAPAAVSTAQRKQGMTEAPPLVQLANLPCQISDARFAGKGDADKKAGTPVTNYYEVACGAGNMGFIVASPAGGTPSAFTCVEANTPLGPGKPAALPCVLPDNADPKAALVTPMKLAGLNCTPENVRALGQTKESVFMEVACQGAVGYVLVAPWPFDSSKKLEAQNCLSLDDLEGNVKCTLTDKATRLAIVDRYNTDAKTGCAIKDRRYVGQSQDGSNFYETACQDGKGYIYKVAADGVLSGAFDCARALNLLGGCTLTDARQAATEQAGLYTRLAKAAGSSCDVDHYAVFPAQGDNDVVELVCKDGSGGVGIFPTSGPGTVLDCGHAPVSGYKCSLTDPQGAYASLTADLKKFDKKDCEVSDMRLVAKNDKGNVYIEVACADHLKGYMVEYTPAPVAAVSVTGCALIGGCKLPGNT